METQLQRTCTVAPDRTLGGRLRRPLRDAADDRRLRDGLGRRRRLGPRPAGNHPRPGLEGGPGSGGGRGQPGAAALQPDRDTGSNVCLVHTGGTTFAEPLQSSGPAAGWCRAISGTVEGGSFTYSVRPGAGMLEIVATGTSVGATRRAHVTAHSSSGRQIFSDATRPSPRTGSTLARRRHQRQRRHQRRHHPRATPDLR